MAAIVPAKLALELQLMSKRIKEFKTDCIRKHDKWGQNFRAPLLASCLAFSTAREIANANAVCSGWRLPQHFEDRLMKPLYIEDFTLTDSNHPKIAPREDSPWRVRYGRRQQVHNNMLSNTFRDIDPEHLPVDGVEFKPHSNHRQVQLILYNPWNGSTRLASLPGCEIINTGYIVPGAYITSDGNVVACLRGDECILYDIPTLLERERIPGQFVIRALQGDFLVLTDRSRGSWHRLVIRSIASKKELWETTVGWDPQTFAIEETNQFVLTTARDHAYIANLLDGSVLGKCNLRDGPLQVRHQWHGLPVFVVYNWPRHTLYFLRLESSGQLVLDRQLDDVPERFDHRMHCTGRLAWQSIMKCLHLLDLKTGQSETSNHENWAWTDVTPLFMFAAMPRRILDFTVGLS